MSAAMHLLQSQALMVMPIFHLGSIQAELGCQKRNVLSRINAEDGPQGHQYMHPDAILPVQSMQQCSNNSKVSDTKFDTIIMIAMAST